MLRKIIEIDENKCNGCGLCAGACHEGAIGMVGGKARLLREDYCDGLGDCLPACPMGAIAFVERDAPAYDADAVERGKRAAREEPPPCGCSGSQLREVAGRTAEQSVTPASQLRQWPVQIKLAPVEAPYLSGASLLIAADCSAYAYAGFHREFMRGKITLIGCPKLDAVDYSVKLTEILRRNTIKSVTVVRMEVPCCGGIEHAVKAALQASGSFVPCRVVTLSTQGRRLD